jgi:hypothetical protein
VGLPRPLARFDAGAGLLFYPGMTAPPDQLFLRPTEIGGIKHADDYIVIWDGISIGRILKQPGIPPGRPDWSWGVGFPHKPQQAWMRGMERDLEECKRRFKLAWSGVYSRLTPEDIEAARKQQTDSRRPWKR